MNRQKEHFECKFNGFDLCMSGIMRKRLTEADKNKNHKNNLVKMARQPNCSDFTDTQDKIKVTQKGKQSYREKVSKDTELKVISPPDMCNYQSIEYPRLNSKQPSSTLKQLPAKKLTLTIPQCKYFFFRIKSWVVFISFTFMAVNIFFGFVYS